jgi:hypothetical protein
VCAWICLIKVANPLQEVLRASLLEQAHERRFEGLACVRGHLCDRRLSTVSLLDIAASDLLELQVSCDIGGDQDVGELAVAHQELRDKVDVPVVYPAVLLPRLSALLVVAISLEQRLEVDGGGLAAIIFIAIDVETTKIRSERRP